MDKEEGAGQLKMNMLPCKVSRNALFSVLSFLIDHCGAGSERRRTEICGKERVLI